MPIFTRILDFKRAFLARLRNKRAHPRHRVGQGFSLKASLNLVGSTHYKPDRAPARGSGVNWGGAAGDISAGGLSIVLSPAATTARGEPTIVRLTLENHEISIPCVVAHFRVHNSHALCGVKLEFDDFKAQEAYQQIVEAVATGAGFAAAGAARPHGEFLRRSWLSGRKARLTEWRDARTRVPERFELTFGDHVVQGGRGRSGLEVNHRKHGKKTVSPTVYEEACQMFRWIVANMPKAVPADLRQLLIVSGGAPLAARVSSTPAMPINADASVPAGVTAPPVAWEAPKPRVPAGAGR